ncbi:hypothetical protein AVEN_133549-1 [Araneus ventricosus]|uniref:Uncharacterized protein n=1 Tax=Araneus ventricosus TaxID=182803 RepID=A0A4Y2WET3_ARAVE|nr:hypothetical protein AVEN_133549-1 [Araneus ventricosus]
MYKSSTSKGRGGTPHHSIFQRIHSGRSFTLSKGVMALHTTPFFSPYIQIGHESWQRAWWHSIFQPIHSGRSFTLAKGGGTPFLSPSIQVRHSREAPWKPKDSSTTGYSDSLE